MQTKQLSIQPIEYISEPRRKPHLKQATRQITKQQIDRLKQCPRCQSKPVVYIKVKKELVGVCGEDWVRLADTVLGWSGQ
jgi:hypothetical protein